MYPFATQHWQTCATNMIFIYSSRYFNGSSTLSIPARSLLAATLSKWTYFMVCDNMKLEIHLNNFVLNLNWILPYLQWSLQRAYLPTFFLDIHLRNELTHSSSSMFSVTKYWPLQHKVITLAVPANQCKDLHEFRKFPKTWMTNLRQCCCICVYI